MEDTERRQSALKFAGSLLDFNDYSIFSIYRNMSERESNQEEKQSENEASLYQICVSK